MRSILGPKKVRALRHRLPDLDILYATARGNNAHHLRLHTGTGLIWYYQPQTGTLTPADVETLDPQTIRYWEKRLA